jgi:hypothetical protein
MAYSCPPPNVGSDYADPTVPQLITDLTSCFTIKARIYLAALTAIDRGAVLGDLLIAFACVRRS